MKIKKVLLSNATNSKLPDDQLSRLFVGNLNTSQVSKKHVLKLFGKFGQIRAISMHRGYAFVQFVHKEHASSAIRKMHGQLVGGQVIDVNLVTEPKPYQKKLTFSECRPTKPIEPRTDHLVTSKKPSEPSREPVSREPAVREADSSKDSSLDSFKKETSGSYSSKRASYPASHSHPSYSASQNLITSSTERTSFVSSRPAYLTSTNQTKKAVRPPTRQPQQTVKLPYVASFEALMSSIYEQQARSNQSSQSNGNQSNGGQPKGNQLNGNQLNGSQSACYQPSLYLQTYGQPSGYDLIVCGTCKQAFYNFGIFLQHKQAMCPLQSTIDLCITNSR